MFKKSGAASAWGAAMVRTAQATVPTIKVGEGYDVHEPGSLALVVAAGLGSTAARRRNAQRAVGLANAA